MLTVSAWRSWNGFVRERRRQKRARAEALLWNILRRKDHRVLRQGWALWAKLTVDLRGRVKLEDAGFDWKVLGPDIPKENDIKYVAWQARQAWTRGCGKA